MRWLHYFILSLLVLSGAFFGSSILTENVSAVADISGSISFDLSQSPPYTSVNLCQGIDCSSYKYLTLSYSIDNYTPLFNGDGFSFVSRNLSNSNMQSSKIPFVYNSVTFDVSFIISQYNFSHFIIPSGITGSSTLSGTIFYTLSDSLGSSSPCPVCPEIPENPYDNKLDSIRDAILIVPAVCLLIYFFYIIFGMIIKTTGGNK